MNVRERLQRGEFNHMDQEWQPDGTVRVTLTRYGDPHVYRMVVEHLNEPGERVISQEVTEA